MEGITILSQNLDYTGRIVGSIFTALFGCIFIFVIMLFYLSIKAKCYAVSIQLGIASIILGLIVGLGTRSVVFAKPTTEYEVIISEEVKLKEFNNKYKIISQNRETYTIVEREKE